jgi:hypothetical protein
MLCASHRKGNISVGDGQPPAAPDMYRFQVPTLEFANASLASAGLLDVFRVKAYAWYGSVVWWCAVHGQ